MIGGMRRRLITASPTFAAPAPRPACCGLVGRLAVRLAILLASFVGRVAVHEMTMLSKSQVTVVDAGRHVEAPCEYHANEFSMFENPVIWKKVQADEETPINIMGNILDPFLTTGRFEVTFSNDQAPRYQMTLRITDVLPEDSGNYTCEIRGRRSTVLAVVVHLISVRAPVTRLNFDVDNHHSQTVQGLPPNSDEFLLYNGDPENRRKNQPASHRHHHQHHQHQRPYQRYDIDPSIGYEDAIAETENPRRVTFIEGAPRRLRCVATGGFPLPEMQILVGKRDVTREFSLSHSVTLDGIQGLRAITYLTERTTDKMAFSSRDDGLPIKCIVTVPGLTPNHTQVHINVLYRPVITCPLTSASVGDRNVALRCEVSAQPSLTALFWIIDVNGTTVSTGQVVNEYWTLVMDRSDGVMETQLFMKQVLHNSFRRYTLVAENSIAANTAEAQLVPMQHTTSDSLSGLVAEDDVIVQPRDMAKRRDQSNDHPLIRSAMTSSSTSWKPTCVAATTTAWTSFCIAVIAVTVR